jgi:hypothetical protein
MKKNRDEPIQVKIDIYMEMSQGNSLKQKMSSFFFCSSTKSENRRVRQVLP